MWDGVWEVRSFHRVSLPPNPILILLYIAFSNKILTSSRNGELVMWDIHKPGSSKVGQSPPFPLPFQNLRYNLQNRTSLKRPHPLHPQTLYIKYRSLLLCHWGCGWGCSGLGEPFPCSPFFLPFTLRRLWMGVCLGWVS
jgi:hypothetical protein